MKAVLYFSLHSKELPAFPCLQGTVVYRKNDSVPNGHPIVAEVDTESHPSGGAGVSSLQGAALKSMQRLIRRSSRNQGCRIGIGRFQMQHTPLRDGAYVAMRRTGSRFCNWGFGRFRVKPGMRARRARNDGMQSALRQAQGPTVRQAQGPTYRPYLSSTTPQSTIPHRASRWAGRRFW